MLSLSVTEGEPLLARSLLRHRSEAVLAVDDHTFSIARPMESGQLAWLAFKTHFGGSGGLIASCVAL